MDNLSADKYNIAWFKLAEFVARGERERALGMYRLLMHSFQDKAYAHQLQGDILLAFQDSAAALEQYTLAAQSYATLNQWEKAASLYEMCLSLNADSEYCLQKLCEIYEQLHLDKIVLLFKKFLIQKEWPKCDFIVNRYEQKQKANEVLFYQKMIFVIAEHYPVISDHIKNYIERALQCFLKNENHVLSTNFLAQLRSFDQALHDYAVTYLASKGQ